MYATRCTCCGTALSGQQRCNTHKVDRKEPPEVGGFERCREECRNSSDAYSKSTGNTKRKEVDEVVDAGGISQRVKKPRTKRGARRESRRRGRGRCILLSNRCGRCPGGVGRFVGAGRLVECAELTATALHRNALSARSPRKSSGGR